MCKPIILLWIFELLRMMLGTVFGFMLWGAVAIGLAIVFGVATLYSPFIPWVVAQIMPQVKVGLVQGGVCTGLTMESLHIDMPRYMEPKQHTQTTMQDIITLQGLELHIDCDDYWQKTKRMFNEQPVRAWSTHWQKLPVELLTLRANKIEIKRSRAKSLWPLQVPENFYWPMPLNVSQFSIGALQWNELKLGLLAGTLHIDNTNVHTQVSAKLYGSKEQVMPVQLTAEAQLHMPYNTRIAWHMPDHNGMLRASISMDAPLPPMKQMSKTMQMLRVQVDELTLQTQHPWFTGKGWFSMHDKGAFQGNIQLHNVNSAKHWQSICMALHLLNLRHRVADCNVRDVPKSWSTQLKGQANFSGQLYTAGYTRGLLPSLKLDAVLTQSTWQKQSVNVKLLTDTQWVLSSAVSQNTKQFFWLAGLEINQLDGVVDWGGHQARIKGNFGVPNAVLTIEAQSPALGRFKKLNAKLQGNIWQHRLEVGLNGLATHIASNSGAMLSHLKFVDLKLILTGGLLRSKNHAPQWQGQVLQADIHEANALPVLRLSKPATLKLGMPFMQMGPAQWFGQNGLQLESNIAQFDVQGLQVKGHVKGLSITYLANYFPQFTSVVNKAQVHGLSLQNLYWNVDWNVITKPWDLAHDNEQEFLWDILRNADVDMNIHQTQGINKSRIFQNHPLELNALNVQAKLKKSVFNVNAQIESRPWGKMQANLNMTLPNSRAELLQAPFYATMNATVDNIAPWAVIADSPVRLSGNVQLQMNVQGTLKQPLLQGVVAGDNLAAVEWSQGIRLENGIFRASIDAEGLQINKAQFDVYNRVVPRRRLNELGRLISGSGRVELNGRLNWPVLVQPPQKPGRMEVQWRNTPGPARPDRLVWSSGQLVVIQPKYPQLPWQVDGAVQVHGAYIEVVPEAQTRLSSDIVIHNSQNHDAPQTNIPVRANITLNLGRYFYVQAKGLRTRLEGGLDVNARTDAQQRLTAYGTIALQDGVYRAYGQDLTITEGVVNVQGALDNPGLRIRAMREGQSVQAGVEVQGTLRRPRLSLVSEPAVSEAEKLSWLLLGRGSSVAGRDQVALITAFQALSANENDEGVLKKLANQIGVDDLGLTTGSLTAADPKAVGSSVLAQSGFENAANVLAESDPLLSQRLLTVGKRLTDTIQLSIDQSLSTTAHILRLTMQLHRKLSLVVRTGADQAIDVLYQTSKP